jgi:hypothetical protein
MKIFRGRVKKVALMSVALIVLSGIVQSAQADTPTVPTLVSFTMSPNSVDVVTPNTTVTFDLIVNNPSGISSNQVLVTLTDGGSNTVVVPIVRIDSPVNSTLQTVEFKGTYVVGSNLPTGVYKATVAPVIGLTTTGSPGYSTQTLSATTTSTVVGAANSLLVRNGGYLNFAYSTFTGPAFNLTLANHFLDPKYNSVAAPIWKVGESFNPTDYYELTVPTLKLKVKTITPTVCTSNGATVSLISVGNCDFIVYTDKTLDYQYKQDDELVSVSAARIKPSFALGTVTTQSSATLPLSIQGPFVYGPFGLVIPISNTPTVCYPVGSYISIISGGTCTFTYSTPASANYLASDVSTLTFQITRAAQTISFTAPATTVLANKTITLSATASSGAVVTFQSDSPTICSVTGNSLNLLSPGSCQVEAIQAGTATLSPASASQSIAVTGFLSPVAKKSAVIKIVCQKGGKSKTFARAKCPVGYKAKK